MIWTAETVAEFNAWLQERGGEVLPPVLVTMNGSFEFKIALSCSTDNVNTLMAEFEKEQK